MPSADRKQPEKNKKKENEGKKMRGRLVINVVQGCMHKNKRGSHFVSAWGKKCDWGMWVG